MYTVEDVKELTKTLLEYSDSYYLNNSSMVSDKKYDELVDKLQEMETETGFSLMNSPTQYVQGKVMDGFTKVEHTKPMLSAAKTKEVNTIKKFIGNNEFYCSYKLDGLTLVVRYKDGKFIQAITRGNGEYGEDVTEQAKMISNLPMTISFTKELELRGECVISWGNFRKINSKLEDPYSHPRNLASGSLRQLNTNTVKDRLLSFIVFECVTDINENNKFEALKKVRDIGFNVVDACTGKIEDCIEGMQPDWYEYPVDGLIFELNDRAYSKSLPSTGHHEGCRMALKWRDDTYSTKLEYIDWSVGRTGIVCPTAVFKNVEIDGADINRASVHNLTIMKKLKITNHCTVNVYKANMIIPQIDSCENDGDGEISIPTVCPSCGEPLIIKKDNESEVLYCANDNCPAKQLAKFSHFVSKPAMNVDGLSEATLEKFIGEGFIKIYKDIYHLDRYKDQIIHMDGFGIKSYNKLIKAIEESRNVKLENYLVALGIDNIGKTASKAISKYFNGNYFRFLDSFGDKFDFTTLDDFGQVMNDSLYTWYNSFDGTQYHLEDNLESEVTFIIEEGKNINNNTIFSNKRFCITGSFDESREKIQEKVELMGGIFVGSVSKKLDLLIVGDKAGSKLKKAQDLGILIITKDELKEKMIEEEFLSKL